MTASPVRRPTRASPATESRGVLASLGHWVALTAAAGAELTVAPAFTGAPEQLWRIDQLTDGSYRLMPKAVPGASEAMSRSRVDGWRRGLAYPPWPWRPSACSRRWRWGCWASS